MRLAALVAGLSLLVVGQPARAQYPVIDASAVAEAVKIAKSAQEEVAQLQSMLTEVQGIARTIGAEGIPSLQFTESLSATGLSQYAPQVSQLLDSAGSTWSTVASSSAFTAAKDLQSTIQQIRTLKGTVATISTPDFSSLSSTTKWIEQDLVAAKGASTTAVMLAGKARKLLASEAAANAYALALSTRQQLSEATTRASTLAQQASSATTMRGDLAANTAVVLAMNDQLAQVQALLAAILEVQGASRLAETDPQTGATSSSN